MDKNGAALSIGPRSIMTRSASIDDTKNNLRATTRTGTGIRTISSHLIRSLEYKNSENRRLLGFVRIGSF